MGFDYRTWGTSWGTSWASTWGAPAAVVTVDKHDGEKKRKRWEEQRQARERLREQIRRAIEGPDAPLIAPALQTLAKEGPEPLAERVDIGELVAQVELWRAVRKAAEEYWTQERARVAAEHAALERAIDMDDEEILMLL